MNYGCSRGVLRIEGRRQRVKPPNQLGGGVEIEEETGEGQ